MSWTVAGAVAGAGLGSIIPGAGTAVGAEYGSLLGGLAQGLTTKSPKAHKDRYLSGVAFGTVIPRLWGAGRLDAIIIWVSRNSDGTYMVSSPEGGSKKKGTPPVQHGLATFAFVVCETGLTFDDGTQQERAITVDRVRMADQIVYTSDAAVPIDEYVSTKTYNFGDQVEENGESYSSKADVNVGHDPGGNGDWWQHTSASKFNADLRQHPGAGESTFTMAASSVIASHDGIGTTQAFRGLHYMLSYSQDLLKLGNSIPSNISVEAHTAPLTDGDFLGDCCRLAGLSVGDYDFSNLTTPMEGIVQRTETSIDDLVRTFCVVRGYDLTEIDGKIRAVPRGGPVVRTIPDDDLGADDGSGAGAGSVAVPRAITSDRRSLPRYLSLKYVSMAQFYRTIEIIATREDAPSNNTVSFDTGMVLGDDEAKQVADRLLDTIYIEALGEFGPIKLPREYADLAPTDPIEVDVAGAPHAIPRLGGGVRASGEPRDRARRGRRDEPVRPRRRGQRRGRPAEHHRVERLRGGLACERPDGRLRHRAGLLRVGEQRDRHCGRAGRVLVRRLRDLAARRRSDHGGLGVRARDVGRDDERGRREPHAQGRGPGTFRRVRRERPTRPAKAGREAGRGHHQHEFDRREFLDPGHLFDSREFLDPGHLFDSREFLDPGHLFDSREFLDPGHLFDSREFLDPGHLFDSREFLDPGHQFYARHQLDSGK